jgi:hypothetical protein
MNEMLQSIKSDLLSRRLLPALVVLSVVFVAAVAYTVAGGSGAGSPSPSPSLSGSVASGSRALTVVVASANPNQAVSETPSGANYQNKSPVRNPFVPLPSAPTAQTTGSTGKAGGASSSGSSAPSGGSSSGGSGSSGGSAPTPKPTPQPSKKSSKPAPQAAYTVTVLFGLAPATPLDAPKLTSYANLEVQAPLPSKQDVRVVFERVSASGTSAIFKLVQPPILHGQGQCFPNTSECEAVDLAVGQTEELEYVEASGQVAVYQLKVVSIAKNSASASTARVSRTAAAKAAREPSARTSLRLAGRSRGDSPARRRHEIAG